MLHLQVVVMGWWLDTVDATRRVASNGRNDDGEIAGWAIVVAAIAGAALAATIVVGQKIADHIGKVP